MQAAPFAVIFDLDGVLTDTAALHYRSWQVVADELGIPFGLADYERMRGLGREDSLAVMLGPDYETTPSDARRDLAERKNDIYLDMVARMTPDDLFPGVRALLDGLRAAGARLAVASSSRNADPVIDRLGIRDVFALVIDANTVPNSKPAPDVFLAAAERLGVGRQRCAVVEDAAAGVAAARAAGMRVVGVGPAERVGGADRIVACMAEVQAAELIELACGPVGTDADRLA
jgi:beta-phosphoglucomutase